MSIPWDQEKANLIKFHLSFIPSQSSLSAPFDVTSFPGRGSETPESLKKRLDRASEDMEYGKGEGNFDILIVNDDLDTAYAGFLAFLKERYPTLK